MLREFTLGNPTMVRAGGHTWDEGYGCHFVVDIEGGALPFTTIAMSSTTAKNA